MISRSTAAAVAMGLTPTPKPTPTHTHAAPTHTDSQIVDLLALAERIHEVDLEVPQLVRN